MTRKSQGKVLAITNINDNLRKRIRLECARRDCEQNQLILELLEKHLPQFTELLAEEPSTKPEHQNGKQTSLNGGVPIQSGLLTH